MGVVANRKVFLLLVFLLFTILYWAIFFPVLWIYSRPRVSRSASIGILCCVILLFVILVLITVYLVRKNNWWWGTGGGRGVEAVLSEKYPGENRYAFQFPLHRCSPSPTLEPKFICPQEQTRYQFPPQQSIELTRIETNHRPPVTMDICKDVVDTRVLQDAQTQTSTNSDTLYRTSLIMDVQPRSPGSDSLRNSWYYPTLADYYADKTQKLRIKLDKSSSSDYDEQSPSRYSQERKFQFRLSQQEQQANTVHSITDTRVFLKREQMYNNLEIR